MMTGSDLYTVFLESVKDEMPEKLKSLHTREEAAKYFNKLTAFYKKNKDNLAAGFSQILDSHKALTDILSASNEQFKKFYEENESSLFSPFGDYEKGLSQFRAAAAAMPTIKECDIIFLQYLFEKYTEYKSSEDYMRRLVLRRLSVISPELIGADMKFGKSKDEDRRLTALLIFRQFVKQFGFGMVIVDGEEKMIMGRDRIERKDGKIIALGSDNYFSPSLKELIEEKYKSDIISCAKKVTFEEMVQLKDGGLCRLAEIAFSFSEAYFNNQKKTREYLYIFAIAFNMSFRKSADEVIDDTADINKCLFHDFYTDNLVNGPKGKNEEMTVDGYGINWKNFVECIYLYFISADNMSPAMKLYETLALIESCKNSTRAKTAEDLKKKNISEKNGGAVITDTYKTRVIERIFSADKKEFKSFILDNFECRFDKDSDDANVSWIIASQLANDRRTAKRIYDALVKKCNEAKLPLVVDGFSFELSNEDEFAIRYSTDISEENRKKNTLYVTEDFVQLVNRFSESYWVGFYEETHYGEDAVLCRSDILSRYSDALLYEFSKEVKKDGEDAKALKHIEGFNDFYNYFCEEYEVNADGRKYYGVNRILYETNYQQISSKNIFDLLLIFLTYRKCYTVACLNK